MAQKNSAFWDQALQARDKLAGQLADCPAVDFVDIGYARESDEATDVIALRIHLQEEASSDKFPQTVDGIPVVALKRNA